jgi:hypothetical protein
MLAMCQRIEIHIRFGDKSNPEIKRVMAVFWHYIRLQKHSKEKSKALKPLGATTTECNVAALS